MDGARRNDMSRRPKPSRRQERAPAPPANTPPPGLVHEIFAFFRWAFKRLEPFGPNPMLLFLYMFFLVVVGLIVSDPVALGILAGGGLGALVLYFRLYLSTYRSREKEGAEAVTAERQRGRQIRDQQRKALPPPYDALPPRNDGDGRPDARRRDDAAN